MRIRTTLGTLSFVLASSLNPAYFAGCASSEPAGFQYGAEEMTSLALAAADSFELSAGGTRYRVDLDVAPARAVVASAGQPLFASRAYACGNRKLFATASACIDLSTMDVQGTFALVRVQDGKPDEILLENAPVKGQLKVYSLILNSGVIDLTFDGGHMLLNSKDGKRFELGSFWADGIGDDGLHIVYPQ